eukprot:gene9322-11047_t
MNSVEDVYTRPGDEAQASDSNIAGALAKAAIESCPVTGEKVETMPGALSALFAEHACSALLQIFKEHMPTETRAQLFAPGNLWRTAAQVFVTVVRGAGGHLAEARLQEALRGDSAVWVLNLERMEGDGVKTSTRLRGRRKEGIRIMAVRALAAGSSKEESVGTQLGREKGRAVMMLVHHSRNTEQKQWDETLVLSLNGTGRLLRTYMPVLTTLEGFDARWDSFLSFFEGSVIEGSKEVAVAAISALTAILQGHAGTQALPRPLWKRAIRAYASVTRSACAHDSHVQIKSRVELITALTRLYTARRTAFDEADVRALLSLLDQLARAPFSHTEKSASAMLSTMALPPVQ